MKTNTEMMMSIEEEQQFDDSAKCSICNDYFDKTMKTNYKVRDHDHRTGKFGGDEHANCNINQFSNRCLPVVFHNLREFDGHLIIQKAFSVCERKDEIKAIANSNEKFMTFSIGDIHFIDSFQFMASSLEHQQKTYHQKILMIRMKIIQI